MAEYRHTPAAERDPESVWIYTRDQWGTDQARRYTDALISAFEDLAETPKPEPAYGQIRPGCPRALIFNN